MGAEVGRRVMCILPSPSIATFARSSKPAQGGASGHVSVSDVQRERPGNGNGSRGHTGHRAAPWYRGRRSHGVDIWER
jgi:hypothetical protein